MGLGRQQRFCETGTVGGRVHERRLRKTARRAGKPKGDQAADDDPAIWILHKAAAIVRGTDARWLGKNCYSPTRQIRFAVHCGSRPSRASWVPHPHTS